MACFNLGCSTMYLKSLSCVILSEKGYSSHFVNKRFITELHIEDEAYIKLFPDKQIMDGTVHQISIFRSRYGIFTIIPFPFSVENDAQKDILYMYTPRKEKC